MVYHPKLQRSFDIDKIKPELSYRIADFLKSDGGPYDMLPSIKWGSKSEMEVLQTWCNHLQSTDTPYVVTERDKGRLTLWKKL